VVTIQHASAYADDPQRAAEALAEICKGRVEEFHPLPGAFVCLFGRSWDGPLLELYPRTSRLVSRDGEVAFAKLKARATGAGTHFNLKVDRKRTEIEKICDQRGIPCSWRDWAGFLDVWLEDDLLIECDCEDDR
jgi:hypothetical protein